MKKTLLLCIVLALLSVGKVYADITQTVTVNGSVVGKDVKQISFSGDNVTLVFDDDTSTTEDMSLVEISFSYTPASIHGVENTSDSFDSTIYNVAGQNVGNIANNLQKGVYIINKKQILKK